MKKLCGKMWLCLLVLLVTLALPLTADAETSSLEDYVDTEHLAHYLQQSFAEQRANIDLRIFDIPDSLKDDMELFILRAVPDAALHTFSVGYDLSRKDPYLQSIMVIYADVDPQVYAAADVLLRGIEGNNNLSDLEKALLIHDRLILWCEYDWDGYRNGTATANGFNVNGALVERFCLGEGYARAYRYLLARAGIASKLIIYTNHMSNEVFLGDKSYKVDVAWDDEGGYEVTNWGQPISHDLFMKSDSRTVNGVREYPYDNDYDHVFWPDQVFLVDGDLYGRWDGKLYRQEDAQKVSLDVPGQEYVRVDAALGLEDQLLTVAWGELQLLDVHTGELTQVCQLQNPAGELTITRCLDYREDRVACIVDGQWIYPFEGRNYTVTYRNWDGRVLQSATYEYGQLLRAPAVPRRAGYHFTGWDKAVSVCTGDMELTAQFTPHNQPDGWFKEGDTWYYREADLRKIGWHTENGKRYYLEYTGEMITGLYRMKDTSNILGGYTGTYYFDKNGAMQTGWQKVDGGKYYFQQSGEAVTGWQEIGGYRFYFYGTGQLKTGLLSWDGKVYYIDENLGVRTGWVKYGSTWLYFGADYDRVEGWRFIGGQWYYFNDQGEMQTGWYRENTVTYYLKSSGAMAIGWQQVEGDWYYFKSSGAMATGWLQLNGKWYYLSTKDFGKGKMLTRFQLIGETYYYFNDAGAMCTGWLKLGEKWYYLAASGARLDGWQKIGGAWYYLDGYDGMATGFRKINNVRYYFKDSGAMAVGWFTGYRTVYKLDGTVVRETIWYYADSSGALQTGWLKQGSVWYYLDKSGIMVTGRTKINGTWYTFSESGVWIP